MNHVTTGKSSILDKYTEFVAMVGALTSLTRLSTLPLSLSCPLRLSLW